MQSPKKKRIIQRLKILEGQIRGLRAMVENGDYCIKVLHQTAAAGQALSAVENVILENHLATCVIDQIRKGHSDKSVREVMEVYRIAKKK